MSPMVRSSVLVHHKYHVFIRALGDFIFGDCNGSNDRITSSTQTRCRSSFRRHVNGPFCVITQQTAEACDAAHIIPQIKGDEVLFKKVLHVLIDNPPSSTLTRSSKIAQIPLSGLKSQESTLLRMEFSCARICTRLLQPDWSPS
jgi:hypothetical protein